MNDHKGWTVTYQKTFLEGTTKRRRQCRQRRRG